MKKQNWKAAFKMTTADFTVTVRAPGMMSPDKVKEALSAAVAAVPEKGDYDDVPTVEKVLKGVM